MTASESFKWNAIQAQWYSVNSWAEVNYRKIQFDPES